MNQRTTIGDQINWNHVFPSQVAQSTLLGISNMLPNSAQNATLRFNAEQFSPLSYLPHTQNISQQAQYGIEQFAKGGSVGDFSGDMDQDMEDFIMAPQQREVIQEEKPKEAIKEFIQTLSEPSDEEIYNSIDWSRHKRNHYDYDGNVVVPRRRYEDGGLIEYDDSGDPKKPIIVNNPNDPRLKAYQDSLSKWDGASKLLKKIDPTYHEAVAGDGIFHLMNNDKDLDSYRPFLTGNSFAFKKPVQPVEYQPQQQRNELRQTLTRNQPQQKEFIKWFDDEDKYKQAVRARQDSTFGYNWGVNRQKLYDKSGGNLLGEYNMNEVKKQFPQDYKDVSGLPVMPTSIREYEENINGKNRIPIFQKPVVIPKLRDQWQRPNIPTNTVDQDVAIPSSIPSIQMQMSNGLPIQTQQPTKYSAGDMSGSRFFDTKEEWERYVKNNPSYNAQSIEEGKDYGTATGFTYANGGFTFIPFTL